MQVASTGPSTSAHTGSDPSVYEHKNKITKGFTARHGVDRLVWFECYDDPTSAITREKEIKKWRREWKINLIEKSNPEWVDLYPSITV